MKQMKHDIVLGLMKMINPLLITAVYAIAWFAYYENLIGEPFAIWGNILIMLLHFCIFIFLGRTYDAFTISLFRISEMIYSQTLAFLITDCFMYMLQILLTRRLVNVLPMLAVIAAQFALSCIWSVLCHISYFAMFAKKKTAIIYDARAGMETVLSDHGLQKKFDVIYVKHVKEALGNLSVLNEADAVFLSGIHSHDRNIILKYCIEASVDVYVIPRVGDVIMSGAKSQHILHLPVLRVGRYNPSPVYLFVKRVFDIVASGIGLLLLSPLFLITAILIRSDGGPVFYKQERLTKNGKSFYIHKFRSMKVDAEKDGVARLSTGDKDDRITPVGRVIRKFRIDELPQLIDILAGDLSIVGPRPERPQIAAQYEEVMPEFHLRLQAKAGLTGYAQVYGQYNTTPYDKLQMDLMYISHPSILEDLRLCFATVKILFLPESTEGVTEGQTTALDNSKQ